MKKAFTMIELIFVIVLLGILASVALPRLSGSKKDAEITKARAQISAIRSGIQTKRSGALMAGNALTSGGYLASLEDEGSEYLFSKVMNPGIKPGGNDTVWGGKSPSYTLKLSGESAVTFTYSSADGTFKCDGNESLCKILDN